MYSSVTVMVCLLLCSRPCFSITKYISPQTRVGRAMECTMPNNYGLISNCLFLRIIPNGCASKAPFHFESGLEQFEDSTSHVVSRRRVQFWFNGGDWGIWRCIRNDTEIQRCTFFSLSQPRHCAVQSSFGDSVPAPLIIPCIYTHYKAQENKNL